jgi:protein-S-isoprenylcysteine O-methyltransferase Ste14
MSSNTGSTRKGGSGAEKKPFDLIQRGVKDPTPGGTLTFIGLRLADIPLQKALLAPSTSGLGVRVLSSLGLRTIFTHTSTSVPPSLLLPIDALASSPSPGETTQHLLSPARTNSIFSPLTSLTPTGLILVLMSAGSAAKQIYWVLFIRQESFPASAASAVSVYNTLVNSVNSLLFLALATSSALSPPRLTFPSPFSSSSSSTGATPRITLPLSTIVGTLLYVAGMTIETLSERQRAIFKAAPENKGKVCKVGLWRWARHINYFGYALWRGGYTMAATGWIGGLAMGIWQGWDLSSRGVKVLDAYCVDRYGEQWAQFKREVPYKMVPGVY